jgi:hypothetical protein
MTFTQLTASLKNFLMGWLLVLGLKESLVECATVCVKSEVMLLFIHTSKKKTLCSPYEESKENFVKKNCRFVVTEFVKTCDELVIGHGSYF